ncbi:hypothetical protein E6H37_03800 [Candidatus Bathyarchaeota archaeon]|nr:MAG: hypothetical protein E6H37_03800 [Candidatus Bathyarchaeota archaeon]
MPVYSTRKFLVLILLSVLVGFALFSGARSALNYLSRSTIQPVGPDYSLACCWPTNDGIVNAPVASTSDSSLTSWVTVRSVNNFSGSVALTVNLGLPVSVSPNLVNLMSGGRVQSAVTFSIPRGTPVGAYNGTFTGMSGALVRSVPISVNVVSPPPDFALNASQTGLGIPAGVKGSIYVGVSSLRGFAGTIDLSTSVSPSGLNASITPASITLVQGADASATLSVGPIPSVGPGQYSVTVVARSGGIVHSEVVLVAGGSRGPDFSLVCCWPTNDGNATVSVGSTYNSYLTLNGLNNFTGTVSLATDLPLPTSISPSKVLFSASNGTNVQAGITISVPGGASPGTYAGKLTGTSGSLAHSIGLTVRVVSSTPDFIIGANQTFLQISQGSSHEVTVTVTSVNGFASGLNLTTAVFPSSLTGLLATVKPANVTLHPGGTASSTLTIATGSTTQTGYYNVTVTGSFQLSLTGPSIFHTVVVNVLVTTNASVTNTGSQAALVPAIQTRLD